MVPPTARSCTVSGLAACSASTTDGLDGSVDRTGVTMGLLNRSAVVVRPREPFLRWAKQDDSSGVAERVFEKLRSAPNVYLLPESETGEDLADFIREAWPEVFEGVLEGWVTDPKMWPRNRTWEMFEEWFEIQSCESVCDLVVHEPLEEV